MDTLNTFQLYALIISNAALVFGAAIALLRFERAIRRNQSFWDSPTGASISNATTPDTVLPAILEQRLEVLQDRIEELARQNAPATAPVSKAAELPFEYAARMAKQGANVEDLRRTCGLKTSEARLVQRLHAQRNEQTTH